MENLYNFNENKLKKNKILKIVIICFLISAVVAILFATVFNFSDKYGKIPQKENISFGDKILYVLACEGFPSDIEYNNETSEICLLYNDTIYENQTQTRLYFTKLKLSDVTYIFESYEEDEDSFSDNIINNLDNELGEDFIFETDMEECRLHGIILRE